MAQADHSKPTPLLTEDGGGPATEFRTSSAVLAASTAVQSVLQGCDAYYATADPKQQQQQQQQQQQHRQQGIVAQTTSLAALEEAAARQPDAKGVVFDRGAAGHPVAADMARWVRGQDETRESFAYEQLLLATLRPPPPGVPVSGLDDVRAACARVTSALPAGAFRDAMRADAEALSALLLRLVCPDYAPWLTLQVDIIGHNACSRWHQDNYVGRAMITYVGPSTWLVDDRSVRYDQFQATQGTPSAVSDPRIVPDYESIHMPPPNAVVLIKGRLWPGIRGGVGITHKAPNMRTDARGDPVIKRLMLKVDLAVQRPGV